MSFFCDRLVWGPLLGWKIRLDSLMNQWRIEKFIPKKKNFKSGKNKQNKPNKNHRNHQNKLTKQTWNHSLTSTPSQQFWTLPPPSVSKKISRGSPTHRPIALLGNQHLLPRYSPAHQRFMNARYQVHQRHSVVLKRVVLFVGSNVIIIAW